LAAGLDQKGGQFTYLPYFRESLNPLDVYLYEMGRIARVVIPDFPHHIIQRGNRRQTVFFNNRENFEEKEATKTKRKKREIKNKVNW
jgi:hypothetical protein